jgi:glycosyltransferase involved in cell wall biosynthesis
MNDRQARVVVGITTRNRAELLPKAIRSVQTQTFQATRIHVLDDGSTDGTDLLRNQFPDATWDRNEFPAGIIRARNHLMLSAKEDYFLSLDDDAWFLDDRAIEAAVEYLDGHLSVAGLAFSIVSPDRPTPSGAEGNSQCATFVGCGHVLRLSAVRDVGGYQVFPGHYGGEERDLCLKLMDADYQIVEMHSHHVWHHKTLTARDFERNHQSGVCNDFSSLLVRYPAWIALLFVWLKIFNHIRFGAKNGLFLPTVLGFVDFLSSAPQLMLLRRPVQFSTIRRFTRLLQTGKPTSLQEWTRAADAGSGSGNAQLD